MDTIVNIAVLNLIHITSIRQWCVIPCGSGGSGSGRSRATLCLENHSEFVPWGSDSDFLSLEDLARRTNEWNEGRNGMNVSLVSIGFL